MGKEDLAMRKFILIASFLLLISCEKHNSLIDPPLNNDLGRFLLSESEIPAYELKRQVPFEWIVGDGSQLHSVMQQKWHVKGRDEKNMIYIEYGEFASEPQANFSISYAAQSYQTPSIWGSQTGSIFSDNSWVSIYGKSIFFLRANVAIKINLWSDFNENDLPLLLSLFSKLSDKIESNLLPEIVEFETAAKKKQISKSTYQQITDPVVHSQLMNGFSLYSTWDSKWVMDSENIAMGIRKEWRNGQGSIIGFDICQFANDSVAMKASDIQGKITYSSVFRLANLDSLKSVLTEWQNRWHTDFSKQFNNVVGVKGSLGMVVYQFEPGGVDTNFFYAILEQLATAMP